MKSKWITVLAGVVAAVVAVSVAIGLTSPDGDVGGDGVAAPNTVASQRPPASSTPAPEDAAAAETGATADRAPRTVAGTWPGRPDATRKRGDGVDWCRAVRTSGADEAVALFGRDSVDAAACTAVQFIFDARYSRLSLPSSSYDPEDFEPAVRLLTDTTAQVYRPRITAFVKRPDSVTARENLGLVLLRDSGGGAGGRLSAGAGRTFYGPAGSASGYRGRAVWINPEWSTVSIRVDRSKAQPRLIASLTASAAIPVFNSAEERDDMATVPTRASFFLRHQGGTSWRIGGWSELTSGAIDYAPLQVG